LKLSSTKNALCALNLLNATLFETLFLVLIAKRLRYIEQLIFSQNQIDCNFAFLVMR